MGKKFIKIFTLALFLTLFTGLIFTYKLWLPLITDISSVESASSKELSNDSASDMSEDDDSYVKVKIESIPSPTPEPFEEYDISLMAVGDNLMHMGLVNSGRQEDGSYNFDYQFESIAPYLEKSDISIINQETVMAGNAKPYSGFPYFNTPEEMADSISKAGFNVVLQSSNHTIDQGLDGLLHVYELWKKYPDVMCVGIHDNPENEHDIPILEKQGVRFAILNYTYGPNLGAIPKSIKGYMNVLCAVKSGSKTNELDFTQLDPSVLDDIKRAKEMADVVIVCPHWGTEYALEASSYQKKFAEQMTEAGADVIIGAHPHVPEPVTIVEASNGNKSLCYYSLGNFVSTGQNGASMLEGMAWVVFHVTENGVNIDTNKSGVLPMVMQYRSGPLKFEGVYALEDYTEELAASHGIRGWGGVTLTVDRLKEWSEQIFGEWAVSKDFIINQ